VGGAAAAGAAAAAASAAPGAADGRSSRAEDATAAAARWARVGDDDGVFETLDRHAAEEGGGRSMLRLKRKILFVAVAGGGLASLACS
jgi:hypothetical protein